MNLYASNRIHSDYTSDFKGLMTFFRGSPHDLAGSGEALAAGPRPLIDSDIEALGKFNTLPFSDAFSTRSQIQRLADPECRVVMTGQQAGLFLGPIFTITKAINAIQLARRLEERIGKPAVAVFWIASDDHDFDEISHLAWTDQSGERRRFAAGQAADDAGKCVGPLPIDRAELQNLLKHLRATVAPSEFRDAVLDQLDEAIRTTGIVGDLFRHLILRLLQSEGLIVVDPWFAPLKRHLPDLLSREISEPGGITALVLETSERLRAQGYTPQVHRHEGAVNLFLLVEGVRARLEHAGDAFRAVHPVSGATLSTHTGGELLALIRAEPERFSPNVVTKPLIRDHVFRPAAYIGGPGELAYYAQLKSSYEAAGVSMPIIVPRSQAVLIAPPIRRALRRLDLTAESWLAMDPDQRREALAARGAASDHIKAFAHQAETLLGQINAVEESVTALDPGLRKSVEKMRGSLTTSLERLRAQMIRSAEQRDEQMTAAAARVEAALCPDGEPQERIDNLFVPHLLRHGPGLIAQLFDALDPENPFLHTIEID